MSAFNITKRAYARERIRFTNGGATGLTATLFNDTADAGPNPNQTGTSRRKASAAKLVFDSVAGDVHFTEEGTAPNTATDNTGVGSIAGARDVIFLESYEAIAKFKAIALTATPADVEVVYYR